MKFYLMSAFHIKGYNRISVEKIAKQEPNCTLMVMSNRNNTWSTFVSGSSTVPIDTKVEYIKDNGNGHQSVPYDRKTLEIRNIITIKDGIATGINDIGMSSSFSMKVCK